MENALSRSLIKWWTRFEVWKKDSKGLEGKIGGSSFRGRGSQIRRKRLWGKNEEFEREGKIVLCTRISENCYRNTSHDHDREMEFK